MMCDTSLYSGSDLVYYTHIPTIILMLALGILVLLSDLKNKINVVYFFVVLFLVVWNLASLFSWTLINPNHILISERIALIGMVGIALMGLFFYIFPENKRIDYKIVSMIFIPLIPLILILPTSLYVEGIKEPPSCESIPGKLFFLIVVVLFYYIVVDVWIIFRKYKNSKEEHRNQLKIFIYGVVLMILSAIFFNVLPTLLNKDDTLTLFTPISGLIFTAFGAFAITKFKTFNVKVLGAQMLTFLIWILIFSQFLFVESRVNVILVAITLLFSIIFGIILIRSVKNEVQRKEELQLMADKLAQANDQLRKLDNAKTEFISIASHQLRTPLTSVKGFVSLIIEGSYGEISPAVRDALEKVYSSTERLIQLVEDLLNVSRIESGRMQFTFEKADVKKIMQEIYDNFVLVAKTKKMYLDLKIAEKIPEIVIDSNKIREVVSNLVDNAFKYTERGGITMKAELVDEAVRITVSDTGIGVPKEEAANLFKKFSRGKDTTRLHAGGTGLGLYVGKNIVDAHKGKIWLESDGEGKGSRFIIELPINHPEG